MSGISLVQVEINDGSDRSITGIIVYDRPGGGTFIPPQGNAFPTADLAPGELFYREDQQLLYVRNQANNAWDTVQATPSVHASTHLQGDSDEIDGDQIAITFVPSNYARDTSPVEVDNISELTSHLKGIDNALGNQQIYEDLATVTNTGIQTTTALYNPGATDDGLILRDVVNITVAQTGLYRLDYSYLWNHDATNNDFVAEIVLVGTGLIHFHRQEPKDSAGTSIGSSGTDQAYPASGFRLLNLNAGTYQFRLLFGSTNGNAESTILLSQMMFYRVS